MAMRQDRISVVIPCYNAAAFLRQTVQSVLDQTRPVHEIIIVDDGSTDDSAAIAEAMGPPVRVFRQANQGESVARNRAMDAAAGEWIAFQDADDVWEPSKLESQLAGLERGGDDYVCCYTDFYLFEDSNGRQPYESPPELHSPSNYRVAMLLDWCIATSTALVRADATKCVRFPETTRYCEDMIYFLKLRERGRFLRIPKPLTGLRVSATQQTRSEKYLLNAILSRMTWFKENQVHYTPEERAYVRERFQRELIESHDKLYWGRNPRKAREYRLAFRSLFGDSPLPPSFRKPLYPRWVFRVRDAVGKLLQGKSAGEGPHEQRR